jgi:hypothetical protein
MSKPELNIQLRLYNPDNLDLDPSMGFTLVKIKEVDGTEIEESKRLRIPITLLELQNNELKTIPRGIYKYETCAFPPGYALSRVDNGLEVALDEDPKSAPTRLDYMLARPKDMYKYEHKL